MKKKSSFLKIVFVIRRTQFVIVSISDNDKNHNKKESDIGIFAFFKAFI